MPIEFDAHGHAYLREDGEGDPFSTAAGSAPSSRGADWRDREDALEEIVRNMRAREFNIDPITRVAGALAFHTTIDLQNRRVLDARTEASLFRGYEL
ncbi:MAG TPA: cytochrome C, partial [Blastocatellia bacterium]|nr:cytochrome C [Blastocatellia bacterium]